MTITRKITTDEARIKEISGFSVSTGTCYGETQDEKKNDSFLVDDFYVKSVQISTVTFDSMGRQRGCFRKNG